MAYMLVIDLADSSEANGLVPHITSENPLDSENAKEISFSFCSAPFLFMSTSSGVFESCVEGTQPRRGGLKPQPSAEGGALSLNNMVC